MKKKYIHPIISIEEINNEGCGILIASRGYAKDGEPPIEVFKEPDNSDDWGDGNDDEGWGDFIDID